MFSVVSRKLIPLGVLVITTMNGAIKCLRVEMFFAIGFVDIHDPIPRLPFLHNSGFFQDFPDWVT